MEKNLVVEMVGKVGTKKQSERKLWSIGLESTLLPFFSMTNASGITKIDRDAIGAPLRLAYNQDGTAKVSKAGRLIIQVAKPIRDQVTAMRESYIATLNKAVRDYVAESPENKAAFEAEVKANIEAGKPIVTRDNGNITRFNEAIVKAEADAAKAEADAAKAEAEAIVKESGKSKSKATANTK